jgi:hypothetical protein
MPVIPHLDTEPLPIVMDGLRPHPLPLTEPSGARASRQAYVAARCAAVTRACDLGRRSLVLGTVACPQGIEEPDSARIAA